MKITPCHARNLLATSLLLLCAACGGQPPQEDAQTLEIVQSGNFFMGTQPIYGHLVNKKDGSWVFTTIAAVDEPTDTSYLVRLNDLTPAFDIRIAECTPQIYPATHRCNPASPFRDEDSGVLDKIINGTVALGTAGKITDISYAYETTFDETAFNQAVDEALVNTGLDRRRMISLLATHADELREARAELQLANEQMQTLHASSDDLVVEILPTIGGRILCRAACHGKPRDRGFQSGIQGALGPEARFRPCARQPTARTVPCRGQTCRSGTASSGVQLKT